MKKSIVLFTAHCGDAEAGAGGTIARYVAEGYRVTVVVMTTSVARPVIGREKENLSPVKICTLREQEAMSAAALLGHQVEFMRINERFYPHNGKLEHLDYTETGPTAQLPGKGWLGVVHWPVIRQAVKDIILREEPEIIFAHSAGETCYEKWAVQRAVVPAVSSLIAEGYRVGKLLALPPLPGQQSHVMSIYKMQKIDGYQDRKYEALKLHASSFSESAIEQIKSRDMLRAGPDWEEGSGTRGYAEAFMSLWSHAPL